jgi:hypothetical protein
MGSYDPWAQPKRDGRFTQVPEWVDMVAWQLHHNGKSLAQVASMFDAGEIAPPSDGGQGWHASAVRRCIARFERELETVGHGQPPLAE